MRTRLKTIAEIARGLTNEDGRRFINQWFTEKRKIKTITRGDNNWFYVIDETDFYYSLPYKENDCKASCFGNHTHFLQMEREKEIRKQKRESTN